MAKHGALVKAYIDALEAKAVLIHSGPNGQPAKVGLATDPKFDLFDALWFAKPQYAELVLMRCCEEFREIGAARAEGWIDLPAREVRDRIVIVSAFLGARFFSAAEIQRDAETAVEKIVAEVEAKRQSGGLAQVNASYKIYRQQQTAKGEKAVSYSTHLMAFTASLIALAARNARSF